MGVAALGCSLASLGLLVLLGFARGDQWQDSTGYPSASGWQAGYPSSSYGAPSPSYGPPTYNTGTTGCATGFNDILPDISGVKNNILATGTSAAIAAILAKLPALIFFKVLIFKLIVVPILFMLVAIPVLAPLLMMLMPMMMNMMGMMGMGGMGGMGGMTTTSTTATPARRSGKNLSETEDARVTEIDEVFRSLLGSGRCLERVACTLGSKDKDSSYRKPITWLLKQLQALVPGDYRDQVKLYRQAYMVGADQGCDQEIYQCQTPQLLVQQEQRTYRLL
ncbi:uncharacterized protein LOC128999564 [Macrosteles quadrilineatus]|uniref:uncharacterized protein LOC128999564 n=1 Tax=Macrosteles quadrilineatus TaxID=74068 RepID=UPI0023E2884E|nr:uncharacterized protein LOC128999564 [Macrosteles quadrilineatus]